MFYIPNEDLKKLENSEKVYEIIEKHNLTDCDIDGENEIKLNVIVKELEILGETKIIEKINNNEIILIES